MSFWQAKTKIRRVDSLFSQYIRTRDHWKCQYKFKCTGYEDFTPYPQGLHCSHWQKRRHEGTRFDPRNCDAACIKCHMYAEEHPVVLDAWKLKQLGEEVYKQVEIASITYHRRDDTMNTLIVRALIKELNQSKPGRPKIFV